MTAEEIEAEAQKAAAAHIDQVHPGGFKSLAPTQAQLDEEAAKRRQDYLKDVAPYMLGGAGIGGIMARKDAIRRSTDWLTRPAPGLGGPIDSRTPSYGPRAEPTMYSASPNVNEMGSREKALEMAARASKHNAVGESTGEVGESMHNADSKYQKLKLAQQLKNNPNAEDELVRLVDKHGRVFKENGVWKFLPSATEAAQSADSAEKISNSAKEILENAEAAKARADAAARAEAAARRGRNALRFKTGLGAVGGALSAHELYDMYNDPNKGDWTDEDYARLIGAVGGVISTVPHPIPQFIGLGMSLPAAAYPYAKDAWHSMNSGNARVGYKGTAGNENPGGLGTVTTKR
jgi:hypothetical protein